MPLWVFLVLQLSHRVAGLTNVFKRAQTKEKRHTNSPMTVFWTTSSLKPKTIRSPCYERNCLKIALCVGCSEPEPSETLLFDQWKSTSPPSTGVVLPVGTRIVYCTVTCLFWNRLRQSVLSAFPKFLPMEPLINRRFTAGEIVWIVWNAANLWDHFGPERSFVHEQQGL